MNKVNGYCQIELPERIIVGELTSKLTTLRKDEARKIIDNLGLGSVKLSLDQEERDAIDYYQIIRDALTSKPPFIVFRVIETNIRKSIVLGNLIDDLDDGSSLHIYAFVGFTPIDCKYIDIYIDFDRLADVNACPTIYDIPISIHARNITITDIQ